MKIYCRFFIDYDQKSIDRAKNKSRVKRHERKIHAHVIGVKYIIALGNQAYVVPAAQRAPFGSKKDIFEVQLHLVYDVRHAEGAEVQPTVTLGVSAVSDVMKPDTTLAETLLIIHY